MTVFHPGQIWLDSAGKPIQAHSGCVLHHDGIYYWYGEDKGGPTITGAHIGCGARVDVIGIRCYSSTDLSQWRDEGLVLPAVAEAGHDLHPSGIVERPKVLYHAGDRRFIMWMHVDRMDYGAARAGCATAATPTGPFVYHGSVKPNGHDCRDMTLFQDDDGTAWLIHSTDGNATLAFSALTPDYRGFTGECLRQFVNRYREAPVVCKRSGTYVLISSGCSGWEPNAAEYALAASIRGPWSVIGNPCVGPDAELTFRAQSSFAIQLADDPGRMILACDRHDPRNLRDSRYVWLPIDFAGSGLAIHWRDAWSLT